MSLSQEDCDKLFGCTPPLALLTSDKPPSNLFCPETIVIHSKKHNLSDDIVGEVTCYKVEELQFKENTCAWISCLTQRSVEELNKLIKLNTTVYMWYVVKRSRFTTPRNISDYSMH